MSLPRRAEEAAARVKVDLLEAGLPVAEHLVVAVPQLPAEHLAVPVDPVEAVPVDLRVVERPGVPRRPIRLSIPRTAKFPTLPKLARNPTT